MFQIERQEKILYYIQQHQKANTDQLANQFQVSRVTVRRDIDALAAKGLIIKTHGGAVAVTNSLLHEIPYAYKVEQHLKEKKLIGQTAARYIQDYDIIILDSGSTTLELAKNITQKDITVVTNDIQIAMELSSKSNVTVNVCGGTLHRPVYTLIGSASAAFFTRFHVNKAFIGCDALDVDFGVSNRTSEEVDTKIAMINAADEVIMITDDSKLDKKVFCHLCDISAIDKLIVNRIDERNYKRITEKGVEVIVAE